MYDANAEAREFVGDTRDDAVAKAASFFGKSKDEIVVKEPQDVYGLSGQSLIVAYVEGAPRPDPSSRSEGDDRGGRRERGRGRDGDRGERGGRGERGPRRERSDRGERGGRSRERGPRREMRDEGEAPSNEAPVASKGTAQGEVGPVGTFLLGTIERMGLGDFEISETAEGDFIVYELRGPAARQLGEGDGRGADALQLLANQAAMQASDEPPRIVVDAEGDAERRESFLGRLASRASKRANETGRSVALDPMNGRDRRMIHVALRDTDGIATMSIGEGRYRQVVVVPEDSPEYDEAVKASEEASSRDR